jgi:hypothetical protein
MPRVKRELHWQCEVCHTGGSAKGTPNTRADKALNSILSHHAEIGDAQCAANFLAIPKLGQDYFLFKMKSDLDTPADFTVGVDHA